MLSFRSAFCPGVPVSLQVTGVPSVVANTLPALAQGAAGETLAARVNWGTYTYPDGETASAPVRQMQINGGPLQAYDSGTVFAEGSTYRIWETASTVEGTSGGPFPSNTMAVPYLQPVAAGGLSDVNLPVAAGQTTEVPTAGDFTTGTDLTFTLQSAPSGVSIDAETGIVTIDQASETSGPVVVRGTTPDGKFADTGFSVTVEIPTAVITPNTTLSLSPLYETQDVTDSTDFATLFATSNFTSSDPAETITAIALDVSVDGGSPVPTATPLALGQSVVLNVLVQGDRGTELATTVGPVVVEYRARDEIVGNEFRLDINDLVPLPEVVRRTISATVKYDRDYDLTHAEWDTFGHLDGTMTVDIPANPKVGNTMTVSDRGLWRIAEGRNLDITIEFARNGVVVQSGQSRDYTFTPDDIGQDMRAQMRGTDGVTEVVVEGPVVQPLTNQIIILVAGQSQFLQHEDPPAPVTYGNLKMWKDGAIVDAVSPLDETGNGYNMALGTAQLIADADPDSEYVVVATVKGGTGFNPPNDQWLRGGVQYQSMLTETAAAMAQLPNVSVGYMLLAHGGASSGMTTDEYRTALATFQRHICEDIGIPIPITLNGTIYRSNAAIELLNDAIKTMWMEADRFHSVDWQGGGLTDVGDGIHLDDASKQRAAARNVAALGDTTAMQPVLSYGAGLQLTFPERTITDAFGTHDRYNPTGGRLPVSYRLEYTRNAEPQQSILIPYTDPLEPPVQEPNDNFTGRVRLVFQDETESPWSEPIDWLIPGSATVAFVDVMPGNSNIGITGVQNFTYTIPLTAQEGDDVLLSFGNRTSTNGTSTIENITVNGATGNFMVLSNTRTGGNAVAGVIYVLTAADIAAGQITASFSSPSNTLRSRSDAAICRNGAFSLVAGMDLTPPDSDNAFPLTNGFPFAAMMTKSSSTPLTITGSANLVLFNEIIEPAKANIMTIVAGDNIVSGTATINMAGMETNADPAGFLATYS